MNKSILTLVLASLALPAMASLSPAHQAKLDSAWSILTANGVNPTVLHNNLNDIEFDTRNSTAGHTANIKNFGKVFERNDIIARNGKEDWFTNINNGVVTIGTNWVKMVDNGTHYQVMREGNTIEKIKKSTANKDKFKELAEDGYDYFTGSTSWPYTIGNANGINRLDSKIRDADIGGEVGSAIQSNALRFKDTIGNLMRLEAAVELGKQVYPTCVEDSSSIGCTNLGFEMEELGEQIIFINPREHYIHNGQRWFINGTEATNEITGVIENTSYLIGWNALYVSDVVTLDNYQSSVEDIIDIADAFILINDSDATFGDLTNL